MAEQPTPVDPLQGVEEGLGALRTALTGFQAAQSQEQTANDAIDQARARVQAAEQGVTDAEAAAAQQRADVTAMRQSVVDAISMLQTALQTLAASL